MIQPSGGRAGVHGLKWLNAGYNLQQIESLRQQLLSQKDIGRVQRAMREFGISVKRDVIQLVKQYNFDSYGIAFTEENYSAWRRFGTGKGTIGNVAYIIHEIAEVEELQQIKSQTGFDFMGKKIENASYKQSRRWKSDFKRYYYPAHSNALKREYEFIASQVNRYISDPKLKITVLQAAAIDPTRLISGTKETQAARHMFVDGVVMREHHHYDLWYGRVNEFIPLSRAMQKLLSYYRKKLTLSELIMLVKKIPIK